MRIKLFTLYFIFAFFGVFSTLLATEVAEETIVPEFREIHIEHVFHTEPNKIERREPPEFMQALYVTAHRATSAGFSDLLTQAKVAGINTIVFDIKEMQGYVYISIRDFPQLRFTYAEPILNINRIVERIHSFDMYAIARVVQFYNIATATRHPYLQPRHREGGFWQERPGQPRWLDSSHPYVQAEMLQLIDIVASSNVDEIQLDYIRFPTEGRLRDALFYFEQIDDLRFAEDDNYIKREKRHVIRDYVREVRQVVDRHGARLSADVFAIVAWQRAADIRNTGQDIAMLTPYLDHIHPMIYSSHFSDDFVFDAEDFINKPYAIVRAGTEKTINATAVNCRVIPYLQAFGWRVNYNREYMLDQLNAVVDAGASGYILWNAGGRYDTSLPWIREWNEARERGEFLPGYHVR